MHQSSMRFSVRVSNPDTKCAGVKRKGRMVMVRLKDGSLHALKCFPFCNTNSTYIKNNENFKTVTWIREKKKCGTYWTELMDKRNQEWLTSKWKTYVSLLNVVCLFVFLPSSFNLFGGVYLFVSVFLTELLFPDIFLNC